MSTNKRQILVEGMTCTNCALSVTKRLEKMGLQEVNTDFLSGEVQFSGDVEFEEISTALSKIGYVAKSEIQTTEKKGLSSIEWKFLFSLVFTVPLFLHMFLPHSSWLNHPWIQFSLCLPVFVLGGIHFGRSGWGSIRSGVANMDVLIFLGSTAAFAYSLWGTLLYGNTHEVHNYLFYETAATIITLVFLGNLIEHRSVNQTTTALKELTLLQKTTARRIRLENGQELIEDIPSESVVQNDVLQVNTGDRVPVDGEILQGSAHIDESMVTGESHPVRKSTGAMVIGGTILHSGQLRIKATKIGKESTLAHIIELVKQAQMQKPGLQKLSDKISSVFVPAVVAISILTFFLAWMVFDVDVQSSLMQSIAVLVISCPCAMGLATPTAIVAGIGRAAKNGILIKGGDTLERFAGIKKIVFDKTGTLTTGKFEIRQILTENGFEKDQLIPLIYSMELHSSHPMAKSIVENLHSVTTPVPLMDVNEIKGKGIEASDEKGQRWKLGSAKMNLNIPEGSGQNEVYLFCGEQLAARIVLEDQIKTNAAKTIRDLNEKGIETILLSGDKEENCRKISSELGITTWYSEQSPEEKLEKIKELSKDGACAMVGDGINDAPALSVASLGISMGDATQIAIHSSQIVLLSPDLSRLTEAYLISKHSMLTIRQNLFWAFFYNVIAIPIAAAGFLSPIIGSLSMAFSDVIVVGNSIRLKSKRLK